MRVNTRRITADKSHFCGSAYRGPKTTTTDLNFRRIQNGEQVCECLQKREERNLQHPSRVLVPQLFQYGSKLTYELGGSLDRISPRYAFEARIRIRVQREAQNVAMEGWARDISETGISAFVAQALIVGELVTLEIPLASSGWQSVPAKVARGIGTHYGFQFTALSPNQRENIRAAIEGHSEISASGRPADRISVRHQREAETHSVQKLKTQSGEDTVFAERARVLIKRGYTPKVAVELVLHEMEFEEGKNSAAMEKARADAEKFLTKARQGLL